MLFWWLFLTITCLSNLLVGVGFSKVENISDISFLVARRPLLWHQPTTMPRAGPAFPLGLKRLVKSIPGSIEAGLEAYGGPAPVLLRHLMFFFKARMQSELERLNLKYRLRRNSLVFAKIVNKDTTRGQDLIEAQRGWFINTKQGLRASVNRCLEPREESYHWILQVRLPSSARNLRKQLEETARADFELGAHNLGICSENCFYKSVPVHWDTLSYRLENGSNLHMCKRSGQKRKTRRQKEFVRPWT